MLIPRITDAMAIPDNLDITRRRIIRDALVMGGGVILGGSKPIPKI